MKYDVVIIGSGVAGLTAGIYSARAKKSVLIIEEGVLGGTTATLDIIENYPGCNKISGFELVHNMFMQAVENGVDVEYLTIKSIDFDKNIIDCDNNCVEYGSLIIACGTSYKRLNVSCEDKYKQKGLSYCAVCDGALYKNKNIAVVTKGMTASDSIEYLYNITKNIIVLDLIDTYKNDKIKVFSNVKILELNGDDVLQSIEFISNNEKQKINIDGMFISLGKETDLSLYKDYVETDGKYILSDENMHTCIPNVFVAGDVRKKNLRQIVTACSDGAIAATEAIKYLQKNNS